ncbi:MAG: sugar phosphate nucleotidyltransferase [Candidatus Sumerlaeota bacterium]
MKAVIPTAGEGTRLRPFTHTVPKVLLRVADKPILQHIIDKLIDVGVEEVTCVVGYLGKQIEAFVRETYPDLPTNFVEQEEPRGLGHAIHLTAEHHRADDSPLLIILGDTIIDADLSELKDAGRNMIGVREVDDPSRFGVVEVEDDRILSMVEKPEDPPSNLAIVGVYYLTQAAPVYDALAKSVEREETTKGEIQLTDALQKALDEGFEMHTFSVSGWHDCGTPESLLETNRNMLEQRFPKVSEEFQAKYPTIRVHPPVYIAPSADISDSIVGPNVSIGEGVKLKRSIVRNSILNEKSSVQNVILADSIIGSEARVRESSLRMNVGAQSEVIFD